MRSLLVLIVIALSSQAFQAQPGYVMNLEKGAFPPDASHPLRVNDSVTFKFTAFVEGGQPTTRYDPIQDVLCYLNDSIDHTTSVSIPFSQVFGDYFPNHGDGYSKVTVRLVGEHRIIWILTPYPGYGFTEYCPFSFQFPVIDTPSGSYTNIPHTDYYDTILQGDAPWKSLRIENQWLSSDSIHVSIRPSKSHIIAATANRDSFSLAPGHFDEQYVILKYEDSGTFLDSVTFITDATQSPDTSYVYFHVVVKQNPASTRTLATAALPSVRIIENPCSELARFEVATDGNHQVRLAIFDALGRKRIENTYPGTTRGVIDFEQNVSGLETGLYLYEALVDGRSVKGKLQVLH
jgi:hypothetical protein